MDDKRCAQSRMEPGQLLPVAGPRAMTNAPVRRANSRRAEGSSSSRSAATGQPVEKFDVAAVKTPAGRHTLPPPAANCDRRQLSCAQFLKALASTPEHRSSRSGGDHRQVLGCSRPRTSTCRNAFRAGIELLESHRFGNSRAACGRIIPGVAHRRRRKPLRIDRNDQVDFTQVDDFARGEKPA